MMHGNNRTGKDDKMPGVVVPEKDNTARKKGALWQTGCSTQRKMHKPLRSVLKQKIFVLLVGLFMITFELYWEESGNLGYNVSGEDKTTDSREKSFSHKPMVVGYHVVHGGVESHTLFETIIRLDPNSVETYSIHNKNNTRKITDREKAAQARLGNSKDNAMYLAEPLEKGDCVARYDWQKKSHPTCSLLHEISLREYYPIRDDGQDKVYLNSGGVRDVWLVRDNEETEMVLKTLRFKGGDKYQFTERKLDAHRRDAVAMERLTASPNVVDVYGYCGQSVINEYAPGGTLGSALALNTTMNSTELLLVAHQVAVAISDVHNVDREGQASMAHGDVSVVQFLKVNGIYKLNDFNYCHFVLWNHKKNASCPFSANDNLYGHSRAPEYLAKEPLSEKMDIFGMGNVFLQILTKRKPFYTLDRSAAEAKILHGQQPTIPQELRRSNEPGHVALVKAINMTKKHDPKMRATAREIETYLRAELSKIGIHPG